MTDIDMTDIGNTGQEAELLQAELRGTETAVSEMKSDLACEAAAHRRLTNRLKEKGMRLDPFYFDVEDYVLRQCRDMLTERWEMTLALASLMGAKNWKNTEYRNRKAEYDKIKAKCDAHAMNIRTLKEHITSMSSHATALRRRIKELKMETR